NGDRRGRIPPTRGRAANASAGCLAGSKERPCRRGPARHLPPPELDAKHPRCVCVRGTATHSPVVEELVLGGGSVVGARTTGSVTNRPPSRSTIVYICEKSPMTRMSSLDAVAVDSPVVQPATPWTQAGPWRRGTTSSTARQCCCLGQPRTRP